MPRVRPAMVILLALGLISCSLLVPSQAGAQTALANLANSMQPGTWATLTTTNINPTLSDAQGASGFIITYTEYIKWDRVTRRLYFLGGDHYLSGTPVMRHVQYDDATNRWSVLPQQSWFTVFASHGYDHAALDPIHRYFYFRPPNDLTMHRWNIDTGVWTNMPQNTQILYNSCCVGIDYFPEMKGVIWISDESDNLGGVTRLDDSTVQWTRVAQASAYLMGGYHNFAEYNPVHKVVVFGGGNAVSTPSDSRKMWKLDATGKVTALRDAPADLGTTHAIFTVDPVSGDYLVFTEGKQFYVYNAVTDQWALRASGSAVPIWTTTYSDPVMEVVAGPIDTYGVTVFVTCDGSNACRVNLYKHSADSTPPTTPATPSGLSLR